MIWSYLIWFTEQSRQSSKASASGKTVGMDRKSCRIHCNILSNRRTQLNNFPCPLLYVLPSLWYIYGKKMVHNRRLAFQAKTQGTAIRATLRDKHSTTLSWAIVPIFFLSYQINRTQRGSRKSKWETLLLILSSSSSSLNPLHLWNFLRDTFEPVTYTFLGLLSVQHLLHSSSTHLYTTATLTTCSPPLLAFIVLYISYQLWWMGREKNNKKTGAERTKLVSLGFVFWEVGPRGFGPFTWVRLLQAIVVYPKKFT